MQLFKRNRTTHFACLLIVCATIIFSSCGSGSKSDHIAAQDEINSLKSDVNRLQDDVTNLTDKNKALEDKLTALQGEISSLKISTQK